MKLLSYDDIDALVCGPYTKGDDYGGDDFYEEPEGPVSSPDVVVPGLSLVNE